MNPSPADTAGLHAAPAATDPALPVREFLAFRLGTEEYGIDILRVQEIRSWEKPTRIAGTPEFIKGVINLRGVIVPIVDLRQWLQRQPPSYDAFTVVIVLNIGHRVVGMVVDAVCDVVGLAAEQMRAAPALIAGIAGEHLLALGMLEQRMLILLDIDKLLGCPELGLFGPGAGRVQ